MSNKKWYYAFRSAEGEALFFVELTNEEADIIRKFLSEQDNGPDDGYSGNIELSQESFNSKDEAEAYTMKEYYYIWKFDKNHYGS